MQDDIRQLAIGKWHGILLANGIHERFLTGKHTGCPICNAGKDRFRFDDRESKGGWICGTCGAGDGFTLLMKVFGIDFKEAAKRVRQSLGKAEYKSMKPVRSEEENRASMVALWKQSEKVVQGDIVDRYLRSRGIEILGQDLRKIHQCRSSEGVMLPAMLAAMTDPQGKRVMIHRTYLKDVEKRREFMPGKIPPGSAVRLFEADINLGIAEGIETALAASQLFRMPVWAALNAGNMEKWILPEIATNIFIFCDHDLNFRGQRSAYILANNLALKGVSVTMMMPDKVGDWNDVLKESKGIVVGEVA